MAAEIVEDDDVALFQGRNEDLLDVELEERAVDRTVDDPRRSDAIEAQRPDEGHRPPVTVRNALLEALAAWPPAAQRGHVGLDPGLVDEHEPLGIDATLIRFPALRRRAMSGRVRSAATAVFFEAEALGPQEDPRGSALRLDAAGRQFRDQAARREGPFGATLSQPDRIVGYARSAEG